MPLKIENQGTRIQGSINIKKLGNSVNIYKPKPKAGTTLLDIAHLGIHNLWSYFDWIPRELNYSDNQNWLPPYMSNSEHKFLKQNTNQTVYKRV